MKDTPSGQQETIDPLFVSCPRVANIWLGVFFNLLAAFTMVPPTNQELLCMALTPSGCDNDVTATMASYVSLVWATYMSDWPPQSADLIFAPSDLPCPTDLCGPSGGWISLQSLPSHHHHLLHLHLYS